MMTDIFMKLLDRPAFLKSRAILLNYGHAMHTWAQCALRPNYVVLYACMLRDGGVSVRES